MKTIYSIILILLIVSCSGSKKAIENAKEDEVEVEVEIEKVETKIEVEEVETEVEVETEEKVEPQKAEEKNTKEDSFGLNQTLSKRVGPLHILYDELLQKYVSKEGNVNYKGFKSSHKELLGYISVLQKLYPYLDSLSREDKLAYWINAYNALTIDLILRNYPVKSIKDIKDPWDQRLWKFGDKWFNLNQIEHEILRKMDEPRIHFAIVCASFSCPKLQNSAFTAENLDAQLTEATKSFLADPNRNDLSEDRIAISKIFKWFKSDFTENGSVIDFLNQYSEVNISSNAKKTYKDYNWDLND
ncbi:DUF547 domain-containing protein [Winogradskyella maritima]|uniref:DUF547 domain-containing protein n=1 Tax=Winogradskyella maritima TaxID=1517766 RepID=A0ABV8AFP5_9FLAO|nr:DUF547 domain-containing protein [Winogradskyella maritima]